MAERDKRPRLSELTDAILDGESVDWDAAESHASVRNRGIIRQLRYLSSLAEAHRSLGRSRALPPSRHDQVALPSTWGPLELIEHVGRGSFGDVYRAWDPRLDRHVALKLLRPAGDGPDGASAIVSEGRLLARVRHPNVVTVHGADRIDGRVGLWMEFVQGHTLERLLSERGAFGPQEALLIGVDLCRALAAVHRAGVVHRDIKTQNVIREEGGRIVLMDFGTGGEPALAEHDATLSGTPLYLAPELFDGRPATQQSDIYSLGVLVFHLVTRSFPVLGRTVDEVRRGHIDGRRVWLRDIRPDLSEGFIRAIEPALAQDPGSRYHTAGEMEQGLLRAITGWDGQAAISLPTSDDGVAIPVPSISAPAIPVPPRRRWVALAAAGAVVTAFAGATLTFGIPPALRPGGTSPRQSANGAGGAGPELAARRISFPPHTYVGRPSPDGRYLSYVDLNGDLCLHELAGGMARCLTNKGASAEGAESQMAFSPDGKKLAYTWRALDGVVEIRLVGDDGEWPRVLLRRPDVTFPNPLQWTADGTSILALLELPSRAQQLVLIGEGTGAVTALKTFTGGRLNPAISPDGRIVVFDRPQDDNPRARDIYALSVDNPAQEPYVLVQHSANDLFPVWTPDGRLLFVSDRTGSLGLWAVRVADGARTGDPELVARDLGRLALPLGLTNGGALYYQLQNGMIDVFVQTVDLAGGAVPGPPEPAAPALVGMNTGSEWSPDGRSLAYVSLRGLVQNDRYSRSLMIRDVGTGRETALAPALTFFLAPRWSPDGRTILVRGTDLEGREGIFAIDAGSGQTTPAVIFPVNVVRSAVFQWAPDGRSIWYDKSEARAIVAHAIDGGQEDVVIGYGDPSIVRLVQGPGFRVSPDGRSIAYTGFTFQDKKAGTVVYARALDGPPIELARASSPARVEVQDWSPDGAAVLLTKRTPAERRVELVEARLDGAPLRTILANSDMRDVALRRDGRAITYTAGANTLEVWVLENFLTVGAAGR